MQFFTQLPNRDEALEVVYGFVRAISRRDLEAAAAFVQVKNTHQLLEVLTMALQRYLDMIVEDEEFKALEDADMVTAITDPTEIDESLSRPEFTGNQFVLQKEESVSFQLGFQGEITPIRLHFGLTGEDAGYYFVLQRLTA